MPPFLRWHGLTGNWVLTACGVFTPCPFTRDFDSRCQAILSTWEATKHTMHRDTTSCVSDNCDSTWHIFDLGMFLRVVAQRVSPRFCEHVSARSGVIAFPDTLMGQKITVTVFVCSKPSLKFVKKILRFSPFRPGYWEENSTKTHEQWPEKCSMATGWDQKRLIGD